MSPPTTLSALIGLGLIFPTPAAAAPLWLAVGPPELTAALGPLIEHRRNQGWEVAVSRDEPGRAVAAFDPAPQTLLIVGDVGVSEGGRMSPGVPTRFGRLYRWRAVQEESYAADPLFADLDQDGIPDFPVGRIPARNAAEVAGVVEKILAYEGRALGPADLGLPVWGGTPALGALFDEAATTLLLTTVRKLAPAWSEPWLMFGNPRSPLAADSRSQPELFNDRLVANGYLTAMIGHGGPQSFLSQSTPSGEISYSVGHAGRLRDSTPSAPHLIFACDCGSFDHGRTSLAEAFLYAPGGPVAVIAATTESHPLTNYYSSLTALEAMGAGHRDIGQFWQHAQARAHSMRHRLAETLLKNAEGALEAEIDIPKLKDDHLLMYALLGDPATRLTPLRELSVAATPDGGQVRWQVDERPAGAKSLHVQRRLPARPPRVVAEGATAEDRLRLFAERNAAYTFETLEVLPADADWKGSVERRGRMRWVAVCDDGLAVATHEFGTP